LGIYVNRQDLEDEVGGHDVLVQLTDDAGTNEVDFTIVDKALAYAEGTFESYVRTRYTLPVPATEKVKSTCLDLAVYKLRRRRAKTKEAIDNIIATLYTPSIKFLEALQGGKAALDIPAAEETATLPANPDRVLRGGSKPVFSETKLKNF
jgi:phage gp36-like protein